MVAVRRIGAAWPGYAGSESPSAPSGEFIVRDFVKELRAAGVRVDFPLDLGDFAPPPPRRRR
jgi:hypothetical protein